MCSGLIKSLMGKPDRQNEIIPAAKAEAARDSNADVKDSTPTAVDSSGTDVAVKRTKKSDRQGVPGLNL
jgi:hypothetical protein